ncbi:MAG: UTP--glucose-1-phosphate uridylyltransferase [Armatimonadota bacterium]|nr:UTP--glucose-1-phosphate uridylyltransferase [Armatimonadota bacterium]
MPVKRAVIPALGLGRRLYPITKSQPKEMLPLGRKPAIHVVVEELINAGIEDICIVTSHSKQAIEDHFDLAADGDAGLPGGELFPPALRQGRVHIYYVRQPMPNGLGNSLLQAEGFVGDEPFVVACGDTVLSGPNGPVRLISRMVDVMDNTAGDAVLAVRRVPKSEVSHHAIVKSFGPVEGKPHFMVEDIIDQPPVDEAPSDIAVVGRYVLQPIIFDYLKELPRTATGELRLPEALRRVVHTRESVWAAMMKPGEGPFDVDNFLQYSRAFIRFSLNDPEVGLSVREYMQELMGN